jgi:hypothetical protein
MSEKMSETEKKKLGVHLQLSVFRSKERYRIVNIRSFEGFEGNGIYAYGFTENGKPVLNPNMPRPYEFNGSVCGHVNLNLCFNRGVDVKNQKIMEFDALVVMVSNYGHGLGISKEQIEAKVKILIGNDAETIYFYKQSSVYGMTNAYDFKDSWLISGKDAVLELDHWNSFLKSIGSQWRILTPKTRRLLRKLEYQKLNAELEV